MQHYQQQSTSSSSSLQQAHHRSHTPNGPFAIQQSKSQQSIYSQQQQPPHRISNPNSQPNNQSSSSNRQPPTPPNADSFTTNRQMIERQQHNIPQPQYMHGVRNSSLDNKENSTPSYQQVATLPNYQSHKPSTTTSQNYLPPMHGQSNQNGTSQSNSNNFYNQMNNVQQHSQNSQRIPASPHNLQNYSSNPSSSRFTPEQLKNHVTEQLEEFKIELMKNFQSVVQECLSKNQVSSNSIENLKRQIGSNKLDINDVNQKMEDINLRIEEIRDQAYNQDININEEQLEREVQQTIRNLYSDKIENIENNQSEIRQVLDNLKDQLVKEISEQMNSIGNAIQTKAQEEDEIIYQNISDVKHQWEKKLSVVFDQMNNKVTLDEKIKQSNNYFYQNQINNIEVSLENFKKEKAMPKAEFMQNEIYQKFDECVKRYESQLMHVKAQIDSKLDKQQLQEVIQGYRNIKENEIFNKIGLEVENLKRKMQENSQEIDSNAVEFERRMRQFEQFVEAKLKEYNLKLKDKLESSSSIDHKMKEQEVLLEQFDEQINKLNQEYENLQSQLASHDMNASQLKSQSDERFQKLASDLNLLENTLTSNHSKVQKDLFVSHQSMDDKVNTLNKEMQLLLTQMSTFQNTLDENIEQFSSKIALEQSQNQKILNQIQQKPGVSPKNNKNNNNDHFNNNPLQKLNQNHGQDNMNRIIDGKESQVSTKYDDYLQKYEDFNKEVSHYLQSNRSGIDPEEDEQEYQNQNEQFIYSQYNAKEHNSPDFDRRGNSNLKDEYNNQFQQQNLQFKQIQQNQKINEQKHKDNDEEEEEEVVYELDDKGYLIDEKGNYILDDEGKPIQLSSEHIEYLKTNDMLQEED